MAANAHRVKFSIRIEKGYTKRYQVIKHTRTNLPPHNVVILGSFTKRKTAEQFKRDCSKAYNDPAEIEYRKHRAAIMELH